MSAFVAAVIGMIRARDEIVCHLKNAVLFLVFITLCIGSSSVTIRVEMRWVYVAYAAALLFFAYLSRVMGKAGILGAVVRLPDLPGGDILPGQLGQPVSVGAPEPV